MSHFSPKIKIIYDNRSADNHLEKGWGFSALVEDGTHKILFDTGASRTAFFSNCEKLKIRFEEITHVVFSHRHKDHIAGFHEVLSKLPEKTKVYLPKLFLPFLFKKRHPQLEFHIVQSFAEIDKNIYSLVLKGGFFLYEQALILNTSHGKVVITGCAHPGIVNILKATQDQLPGKIYFVLGGFHLFATPRHHAAEVVKEFQDLGVQKVAPCHCSGDLLISKFQKYYQNDFIKIGTGSIIPL